MRYRPAVQVSVWQCDEGAPKESPPPAQTDGCGKSRLQPSPNFFNRPDVHRLSMKAGTTREQRVCCSQGSVPTRSSFCPESTRDTIRPHVLSL